MDEPQLEPDDRQQAEQAQEEQRRRADRRMTTSVLYSKEIEMSDAITKGPLVYMPEKPSGLALLREPFPPNQISKLPKPTKSQTDCPNGEKVKCEICGSWHHPKVIHLDYVGHAALTDRLLDADPNWHWEPLAFTDKGLPQFDETGGLWIKLTVCGMTRMGYGHAAAASYKEIGAREKEVIGDALRNAAMRFGAALELWHKGELHVIEDDDEKKPPKKDISSKPAGDAVERMNGTQKGQISKYCTQIEIAMNDGREWEAYDLYEVAKTSCEDEVATEWQVALWDGLRSGTRRTIKACGTAAKNGERPKD
jgi:hypothetical protein